MILLILKSCLMIAGKTEMRPYCSVLQFHLLVSLWQIVYCGTWKKKKKKKKRQNNIDDADDVWKERDENWEIVGDGGQNTHGCSCCCYCSASLLLPPPPPRRRVMLMKIVLSSSTSLPCRSKIARVKGMMRRPPLQRAKHNPSAAANADDNNDAADGDDDSSSSSLSNSLSSFDCYYKATTR